MASLLHNESSVPSPTLLIDLDAVEANIRRMIEFVAGEAVK